MAKLNVKSVFRMFFLMMFMGVMINHYCESQKVLVANSAEELEEQTVGLFDKLKFKKELIVIDAGHGGDDPGSINGDVLEKDLNLQLALKLEEALKEGGYEVVMTRRDDSELGLYERAELANDANADLFISLHQNSFADSSVHGIEVFYNEGQKSDESKQLAQFIQTHLVAQTGAKDRGIRSYDELVVTRETEMPACLIETAYISNDNELSLIITDDYQNQIIKGIVNGINQFFE